MAKRPTLTDINSLTNSSAVNSINQNWTAIEEAFDNTLSLDGSTPNALNADLDLNGNALLNVGTIDVENLTLDGQTVTDLASVPEWRGTWLTGTVYAKNDLVKTAGNVYICLIAHTSGTFSTDLTALRWELMVSKGDSGAGTGDLISTNNLSDLANVATARSNLGLGTVATESTVPVAKGGTGATDAATARTNLGAQASDTDLTAIAGLTPARGDLIRRGASAWERLTPTAAGQVATWNGTDTVFAAPSGISTQTAVTPTGVTFVDLTGIPATAQRVTVMLQDVSLSGTDAVVFQLGTTASVETSGYGGSSSFSAPGNSAGSQSNGAAFFINVGVNNTNAATRTGAVVFQKITGNTWVATGNFSLGNTNIGCFFSGAKTLGDTLTRVRVLSTVSNTFDAGTISIAWE